MAAAEWHCFTLRFDDILRRLCISSTHVSLISYVYQPCLKIYCFIEKSLHSDASPKKKIMKKELIPAKQPVSSPKEGKDD